MSDVPPGRSCRADSGNVCVAPTRTAERQQPQRHQASPAKTGNGWLGLHRSGQETGWLPPESGTGDVLEKREAWVSQAPRSVDREVWVEVAVSEKSARSAARPGNYFVVPARSPIAARSALARSHRETPWFNDRCAVAARDASAAIMGQARCLR